MTKIVIAIAAVLSLTQALSPVYAGIKNAAHQIEEAK